MNNPLGVMQEDYFRSTREDTKLTQLVIGKMNFAVAAEVGLDCIEFILDYNKWKKIHYLAIPGVSKFKN